MDQHSDCVGREPGEGVSPSGGVPAKLGDSGKFKALGVRPAGPAPESAEDPILKLRKGLTTGRRKKGSIQIPVKVESEMRWLVEADTVREINDNLPTPELRKAFSSVRFLEALPIIDRKSKSLHSVLVAISDVMENGSERSFDGMSIPIEEDLVPRLKVLGYKLDMLVFLLLPRKRYLELTKYADHSKEAEGLRREKLNQLDPEATARAIFPQILAKAISLGTSDIHIEPRPDTYNVRFRVGGRLQWMYSLPADTGRELVNVVKVEADLKSDENRIPQDGRISLDRMRFPADFPKESREMVQGFSLRVSTTPTVSRQRGEKVVLRLLQAAKPEDFDLDHLNIPHHLVVQLKELLRSPHGMILVTGPTGSGKTRTLYAVLRHLNTGDVNIMTAEDPVEVRFPDMDQCQVDNRIELNFVRLLRSFLRQDPDIILVGEVRDEETASIALQAAQTGHLVLATLHTNDVFGSLHRLKSFGKTGSEIESGLRAVLAQRLVSVLCDDCAVSYDASAELNELLGEEHFTPGQVHLRKPRKRAPGTVCLTCNDSGYVGRIPVIELWVPTAEERSQIVYNSALTHDQLAALAVARGLKRMAELGLEYVSSGRTSLEEVLGTVAGVEDFRRDDLRGRVKAVFAPSCNESVAIPSSSGPSSSGTDDVANNIGAGV